MQFTFVTCHLSSFKKEFLLAFRLAELALRLAELAFRLAECSGCIHPLHHPSKGLEGTPDSHMRVHSCVFLPSVSAQVLFTDHSKLAHISSVYDVKSDVNFCCTR